MNKKINNRITRFQEDLNDLQQPNVLLIGVGQDQDGDENIIASASIDNPQLMLSGLAQMCADDPDFYTLFELALKIADSQGESSDD